MKKALCLLALCALPVLAGCTPADVAAVVHASPHGVLTDHQLGWCEDHGMVTISNPSQRLDDWHCVSPSQADDLKRGG